METWQKEIILIFGFLNFLVFLKGLHESRAKKNAYGLTRILTPLGIFVWGDAVVFGIFWILASVISYLLADWLLFLLIISIFWVIRSLGETIYWFNQQFSKINRNPPEKLPGFNIFHNNSIWFIHQIGWQCWTIVSIILSIYLSYLWLASRFAGSCIQ